MPSLILREITKAEAPFGMESLCSCLTPQNLGQKELPRGERMRTTLRCKNHEMYHSNSLCITVHL